MSGGAKLIRLSEAEARRRKRNRRERDGGGGGGDAPPPTPLDEPCPVRALGHAEGKYWFFNPAGEVRVLEGERLSQSASLVPLFGSEAGLTWLKSRFPQHDREGNRTDWFSAKHAGAWLVHRAGDAGLICADEPRRGLGTWRGADGRPIVHCGSVVRSLEADGSWRDRAAGFRAFGALWPACAPVEPPAAPCSASVAAELEAAFGRWTWATPDGGAVFFGLYSAGLLGAGIPWRPHGLVVGPAGWGKSTLLQFYEAVSPLCVFSNETTEAGLRQTMASRAAPIVLDEAEGDNGERMQLVIRLLRRASGGSGAQVLRGTSGGTGQRFVVAAPAVLGAILPPALEPQDETRITRVELGAPAPSGPPLPSDAETEAWRARGPALWGRALAALPRFLRNLEAMRRGILARGCPPRLADQVGTILAARAAMLRDDTLSDTDVHDEAEAFAWLLPTTESLAAVNGPALALAHLLQSPLDVTQNGERPTVGAAITKARGENGDEDARRAQAMLSEHGIKVGHYPASAREGELWVYVSNHNPRLERMFANTRWAGARWRDDLRHLPGAFAPPETVRIGASVRCIVFPAALAGPAQPTLPAPPPSSAPAAPAAARGPLVAHRIPQR